MNYMDMILGEKRTISLIVTSLDDVPFSIKNALYQLKFGDEVEDEGAAIIDEQSLIVNISPKTVGRYILEFTMQIADEIVIRRFRIYVRK